tara:strand:+ start:75 stop:725 length:651 start_codon:yes stop_codon:yes gene_type:complete
MKKIIELPNKIPVFPLSNLIIFPETTIPLNIFEPRYIEMINDCMEDNKIIGMIQPKKTKDKDNVIPNLHNVGCMGKITYLNKNSDGTYSINLTGLSRFKIIKEVNNNKLYRECEISLLDFKDDINKSPEKLNRTDLDIIFKGLKILFKKKGYIIDWNSLEKQNLNETVNALAMASPFSLEEKQILLEAQNLGTRKQRITEILNTYKFDNYDNTTVQ